MEQPVICVIVPVYKAEATLPRCIESVLTQQKVYVSGGRIGTQVCCAPADLIRAARADTAKIIF